MKSKKEYIIECIADTVTYYSENGKYTGYARKTREHSKNRYIGNIRSIKSKLKKMDAEIISIEEVRR